MSLTDSQVTANREHLTVHSLYDFLDVYVFISLYCCLSVGNEIIIRGYFHIGIYPPYWPQAPINPKCVFRGCIWRVRWPTHLDGGGPLVAEKRWLFWRHNAIDLGLMGIVPVGLLGSLIGCNHQWLCLDCAQGWWHPTRLQWKHLSLVWLAFTAVLHWWLVDDLGLTIAWREL